MQQYIEEHLFEKITPGALADACHYSPWYAYRLFTQWVKRTPADYIRRLRLAKSALMLRDSSQTVTDVAFQVGFSSVDGYQRAFLLEFGCNPGQYAASPTPLYLFTPYAANDTTWKEQKPMEKTKTVFVQPIARPARKALIQRGKTAKDYYQYCDEVGCDIWGYLTSIPNALDEPIGMWLPAEMVPEGTSSYVQGVELAMNDPLQLPDGFAMITLPAATYLRFQGEPFCEENYEEAINQVWEAIKQYDPTAFGFAWDPSNPRIQLAPIGTRGYIEFLPVKPKAE